MAQCRACGTRNADAATFCVRCGADLRAAEQRPGESTDTLAPVTQAATQPAETVPESVRAAERLVQEASELLTRGEAHAAAAKCREAIALAPDLVAAYSLLGMAEEQQGNTVAAAGAYRRVLQLDPTRSVEREKLELLYSTGAAIRPEEEVAEELAEATVLRYAPWVAAVGAAFLVLIILTAIGLRVYAGHQAERVYRQQMAAAQSALEAGDYRAAAAAFQAALQVRPEDRDAATGLRYARRKLTAGTSVASAAQAPQPIPSGAKILPSSGPNPFPPRMIGPTNREQPSSQTQAPPMHTTRSAPRPPVVDTAPVTGGNTGAQGGTESTSVPFGPLETVAPPPPEAGAPSEEAEPPPAPERRGEITIWRSEGPAQSSGGAATSESEGTSSSAAPPHPDALRAQAEQARRSGDTARAAELYSAAIEAYRAEAQANPRNRQANEAAIEACERARRLCETEGQ